MKKTALLLVLCMVFSAALFGCSDTGTTEGDSTTPPASDNSENTGEQTPARTDLNLALTETPGTFDPHYTSLAVEQTILKQVYEPLIRIVGDGEEFPVLATEYTISEDGLAYTFNIREGVTFQNGDELTASDVVFSFERAKASAYLYTATEAISSIEAPDDHTVVITLSRVYAPFPQYLEQVYIISEDYYNEVGEDTFAAEPCGTGPYTLADYQTAVSATMEAYPDYWGGEAAIKTLNFKVISDTSTTLIAFEAGELDCIGVPPANWADIEASGKYSTQIVSGVNVGFMMMNHEVEPFNDKLVRQAISHAINRDDVCLMAMDGMAVPAYMLPNPDQVTGATEDTVMLQYDPEKAMELLAQAGFPDGFDAGPIKVTSGLVEKVAQVVQSNLAAVGIDSTIEIVELTAYSTDLTNGNYGLGITAATIGYDFSMYSIAYTSSAIGSFNFARYQNPEVDSLFSEALSTVDSEARNAVYKQILDIIQDDAVYVPIFYPATGSAANPNLNYNLDRGNVYYDWSWK